MVSFTDYLTSGLPGSKTATNLYALLQPQSPARQLAGNYVEALGMAFTPNARDTGISEMIAGGPTNNTIARAYDTTTPTGPTSSTYTPPTGQASYNPPASFNTSSGSSSGGGGSTGQTSGSLPGWGTGQFQGQEVGYDGTIWQWDGGQWKAVRSEGGGSGYDPSAAVRSEIENGYNSYFGELDRLSGMLPEQQQTFADQVNSQFNTQQADINASGANQLQKLDASRQEATANKAASIRNLTQDLRNSLQAGQVYLGGLGAGSSSAVDRFSGALAKAANKRTADVSMQADKIFNDINLKQADIESTVQSELNNLQQWKNDRLTEITSWVNDQQRQIQVMRANGQLGKGEALANLNRDIMNAALQRLSEIDSRTSSFRQALGEWALSRSNTLNELKTNLSAMGSYNVPGYQVDPLSGSYQRSPQTAAATPYGFGYTNDEEKRLFA